MASWDHDDLKSKGDDFPGMKMMSEREKQAAAQGCDAFITTPPCKGKPGGDCLHCWCDRSNPERVRYICTVTQRLPNVTGNVGAQGARTQASADRASMTAGSARVFDTGATRDTDDNKLDYEGFLSPLVLERYAEYMHGKRFIKDLPRRDSDNWQKGMPLAVYMKSLWRHFVDVWKEHRGLATKEGIEDALCAVLFNTMGYLHEYLKAKRGHQG
jgi:hypothetical protein